MSLGTKDPYVRFYDQCDKGQQLFKIKNVQYDNTIERTGVLGAVVELIGAVARLPVMVLREPTHGRKIKDKLIDVLLDIHNYASIALMMIESENWEGK